MLIVSIIAPGGVRRTHTALTLPRLLGTVGLPKGENMSRCEDAPCCGCCGYAADRADYEATLRWQEDRYEADFYEGPW